MRYQTVFDRKLNRQNIFSSRRIIERGNCHVIWIFHCRKIPLNFHELQ